MHDVYYLHFNNIMCVRLSKYIHFQYFQYCTMTLYCSTKFVVLVVIECYDEPISTQDKKSESMYL